jgi:hypothetical protein
MTTEDVLRSLKRYVAAILDQGDDVYDVKLNREEYTDRPMAVVRALGDTLFDGSRHTIDITQPFEVFVYPPIADADEPITSSLKAQRTAQLLAEGFTAGVLPGRAMRVPIWNYDGVAWNAAASGPQVGFARMEGFSTQVMVDPDDDSVFTVMLNMRLTWRHAADRRGYTGPTAASVSQTQDLQ